VPEGRVAVRKSDCDVPTDKEELRAVCMERQDSRNRATENHGDLEGNHERRSQERGPKEEQPGRFASRLSVFTV
jgi:hypothetical protein